MYAAHTKAHSADIAEKYGAKGDEADDGKHFIVPQSTLGSLSCFRGEARPLEGDGCEETRAGAIDANTMDARRLIAALHVMLVDCVVGDGRGSTYMQEEGQ
jgi:hypothetical protein